MCGCVTLPLHVRSKDVETIVREADPDAFVTIEDITHSIVGIGALGN